MATSVEAVRDYNPQTSFPLGDRDRQEQESASTFGRLAGFVYHDLRHPLTAILAYAELLGGSDLSELQRQDFYQEIRLAVSDMNDLISLLQELSRDPKTLRPEVADIVRTVKHAIQEVAVRPEFREIVIRYHHEGITEGWFDPRGFHMVVTNIVLNACQAVSPHTGRIEVVSLGERDRLEITIEDNGPGIPEPIRDSLFQPFVSYGKEGGTGLGLAIVQKIMHDHGGELHLTSASNEGTRVKLVLPITLPYGIDTHSTNIPRPLGQGQVVGIVHSFPAPLLRSHRRRVVANCASASQANQDRHMSLEACENQAA